MELSVGIKVTARGLAWEVIDVEALGDQRRVRLCCLNGDLAGLEWDMLHPAEALTLLQDDLRPDIVEPLADWRRFHTARLLEQIPGVPAPAGRITIESWQKVPLLRALDMVRPRLLLADGVGLGKTIQAGLIAAELIARRRAHRVLIVVPPGPLLHQWQQEMRFRFGLRFTRIADGTDLRAQRRGQELGANVFAATALCLTSLDFAKQEHALRELERAQWDLVIIDEAHHCFAEAMPTQRRRLAETLAARSDGMLLLTATPHDGHDAHFASLMQLLDPCLVDGKGQLIGRTYRRHVVRRLKNHIRDARTGLPVFRDRLVVPVRIDLASAEPVRAFHQALSALVAPRLRRPSQRAAAIDDRLAFVSLLKRSLSTIAACVATLHVVLDRYGQTDRSTRSDRRRTLRAHRRRLARFGVLNAETEADIAALEAEEIAAGLSSETARAELRALIEAGEVAAAHDPKLSAVAREIRLIRLSEPDANILVYTEYAASQQAAAAALSGIGGTILTIAGTDSDTDRTRAAERCSEEDGIILISTDTLAEGLNLQARCHHLIHLDLPYNPNRLEQRNGRIDRYGQPKDPEIRYLYLGDTFEERLLLRLIAKYEKARACLSFMPNTLAMRADPVSLREPVFDNTLFSTAPKLIHALDVSAEDAASDSYRDLLRELDRAFQSFDLASVQHGWLSGSETTEAAGRPTESGIDLADFLTSVLPRIDGSLQVPTSWRDELHGLTGYDSDTGSVCLTTDPDHRTALFPTRGHPLVKRAISSVRGGRVSTAAGERLSLLATYVVEAGSICRRVFGVRRFPDGSHELISDIMPYADTSVSQSGCSELWHSHFAPWATAFDVHALAEQVAAPYLAAHQDAQAQASAVAHDWLTRRAEELCGRPRSTTADLFAPASIGEDWRDEMPAQQRLSTLAADPTVERHRRCDAAEALRQFRTVRFDPLPPVTVRPLGLLMVLPHARPV
jgi:superfamily II DNA or RNA helicase